MTRLPMAAVVVGADQGGRTGDEAPKEKKVCQTLLTSKYRPGSAFGCDQGIAPPAGSQRPRSKIASTSSRSLSQLESNEEMSAARVTTGAAAQTLPAPSGYERVRDLHRQPRTLNSAPRTEVAAMIMSTLNKLTPRRPLTRLASNSLGGSAASSLVGQEAIGLVVAFFEVVTAAHSDLPQPPFSSRASSRECFPETLRGGVLEAVVLSGGFCPSPSVFWKAQPEGCGAQSFVFTLLDTTLNPQGDPSGVMYGCVCAGEEPAANSSGSVLCLVSTLPAFELHFYILEQFHAKKENAKAMLSSLNQLRRGPTSSSSSNSGGACSLPGVLLDSWLRLVAVAECRESLNSNAVLDWGISRLLNFSTHLVGDTVARLLACVLLEQKVFLIGDVSQVSTVALLLRALLYPFRWLHPFLSAPPQQQLLSVPLLEGPLPLIVVSSGLPDPWNYQTLYDIPKDVAVGVLNHDYIHTAAEHETVHGLSASKIRLPCGRHNTLLRRLAELLQKLRRQEMTCESVAATVRDLLSEEVRVLRRMVQSYALAQVSALTAESTAQDTSRLEVHCLQRAMDPRTLEAWINEMQRDESKVWNADTTNFLKTFFQTQMCIDALAEEIAVDIASRTRMA